MYVYYLRYFVLGLVLLCACADNRFSTTDGQRITLRDYRGKWVFIHYWAEWCTTCHAELAQLNAFYRAHVGKDAMMLGVNADHPATTELIALQRRMGIAFPLLTGNPDKQLGIEEITQLPMTLVISPQGKRWGVLVGPQTQAQLTDLLKAT